MSRDNIYFNAIISPDPANRLGSRAEYNANLTQPLLNKPDDFYCAVIRFQVPINTIPILKFPLNKLQNNPLVSDLVFGITYLGVKYPVPVSYIAYNNHTGPTPAGSSPYFTQQQSVLPYYDIYSVKALINMFNVTLAAAITASGCGGTAVYSYNPTTQLISLTCNNTFITSAASIFMNDAAYNYVNSFLVYNNINPTVGDDYVHVLTPLPVLVGSTYTFDEDYNAMSLWFSLRKISLLTSTLPIAYESVPSTVSGVTSQQGILTDFVISLDNVGDASTVVVYNPTSQWRLVDVTSIEPLTDINLAFYYTDKFGNQYPLYIDPSQSASIKLAFVRKSTYRGGK